MATLTIKGNNTGGTADPLDLSTSQVKTMLDLSGTNSGDVTLAAVGATPNANGASLTGQVLNLQAADGTNPGALTASAQTIGGDKTFNGTITGIQLDIDNLRLDANTLSSTNTDGDIILNPNGTGVVNVSTSKITNVVDPTAAQDAATKNYVDAQVAPLFDLVSVNSATNMVNKKTYQVDVSGGVVTVTLPTPTSGHWVRVTDSLFNSHINNITIARNGSEKINGVASDFIADSEGGSWLLYSDGTDWYFG
jgi:hypothetical protein